MVLLVPALAGCPAQSSPPSGPPPGDWQSQMLASVNTIRAGAGVPPLSLCGSLSAAAQRHSEEQASRATMTHTGADGSRIGDRAGRAGYRDWTALAENVASGQTSVDSVMWAWMGSPGHRVNILSRSYSHVGFGRAGNGVEYWTQDFGASGTC